MSGSALGTSVDDWTKWAAILFAGLGAGFTWENSRLTAAMQGIGDEGFVHALAAPSARVLEGEGGVQEYLPHGFDSFHLRASRDNNT